MLPSPALPPSPRSGALQRPPPPLPLPALLAQAGPAVAEQWLDFLTGPIRNPHTRRAYACAIDQFLAWAQAHGLQRLTDLRPLHVASYVELLGQRCAPPTVKQHLAAIRAFLSRLTEKGFLPLNPAREVKAPKFSRSEGKTPAFAPDEVQALLGSIDLTHPVGLRDRALLATLAYTFARVGAVVSLRSMDYLVRGKRSLLRFREKGGKEKELPVHHRLEECLDAYLAKVPGWADTPKAPLFRAALGRTGKLSDRPLHRNHAAALLRRRLAAAGLPAIYSPHSFRATGITNFLHNGGSLEAAQRIAGHADSRTTKLYDRRAQVVLVEDIERVRY